MVTLIAEIVSVGTELLLGEIVDTNATFLANELKARGVALYHKNVVGDNVGRIADTLRLALSRADLVIVGGGLGPTDDDLTREAIADVTGETPTIDDELLRALRDLFESRGRTFPDSNRKQAWLIPSGEALPNPIGTAPGWFVRRNGRVIVALPGPPREMQRMWHEQVLPRLELPSRALWHTTLHTWGLGESHIAEKLDGLTQLANPSVATYARKHGVDVRVAASGETLAIAEQLAAPVVTQVHDVLARHVYGRDADTLAGVVLGLLKARSANLASLEVNGALLAQLLSEAQSSAYAGGVIVTHEQTLTRYGLSPSTLGEHGMHSQQAALELARGARREVGAHWGIVSLPGQSVHHMAISGPDGERVSSFDWPTDARTAAERTAHGALMLLLNQLRAAHTDTASPATEEGTSA